MVPYHLPTASPYEKNEIECIFHILGYIDAQFSGRYDDSTIPMWANHGVSLYIRNRATEWHRVSPSEIDLSPYLYFDLDTLSICLGNRWQNLMVLGVFA